MWIVIQWEQKTVVGPEPKLDAAPRHAFEPADYRFKAASANLRHLRANGIEGALYDFGTGYSSLTYLAQLPLDALKIDRSFVKNIESKPNNQVIAESIVSMAAKMGISVVAEGIESSEESRFMRDIGCSYGQGYLFEKPLAADEMASLLKRKKFNHAH